jgi:hypothetical protein
VVFPVYKIAPRPWDSHNQASGRDRKELRFPSRRSQSRKDFPYAYSQFNPVEHNLITPSEVGRFYALLPNRENAVEATLHGTDYPSDFKSFLDRLL